MSMTDPIADMLTRIRNAINVRHNEVQIPASKEKVSIAEILKEEGFIKDYQKVKHKIQDIIKIKLKYSDTKESVITKITRESRPGLRVYVGKDEIPRVLNGLGISILSTSKGIVQGSKAKDLGVGGELLCTVY